MPFAAPHICGCGRKVAFGVQCICQIKREQERKARADRARPSARQRGYDSRWDAERKAFLATNPTCKRCGAPATVVDHIVPHRGDKRLFWDRSNWQPLCATHHSRTKQAQERRDRSAAPGGVDNFRKGPGTGGGSIARDLAPTDLVEAYTK